MSAKRFPSRRHSIRTALTLLELLVVLMILAVVSTIAVNSLQPRVESARFDQTQEQLDNVQLATVGPVQSRQADGTPLVSGFVADVGRLPLAQSPNGAAGDEPGGCELCELWEVNADLARSFPFQFRAGPNSPVDYSDVQIPCGWRGPYLQLPMGAKSLRDSWNRPFTVNLNADFQIESVSWQPIGSYDQAISTSLTDGIVSVTGAINFGQTIPSNIQVALLAPAPDSSRTELAVFADEDDNPTTFTFSRVPVGLRAICVTVDSQRVLTRYVHVPHQGVSLVLDLANTNLNSNNNSNE